MQPSRSRLICRAPNRFTPSIALRQHFGVLNRPFLLQQRLSSSASEAIQNNEGEDAGRSDSREPVQIEDAEAKSRKKEQPKGKVDKKRVLNIKKKGTTKGKWYSTPREASIAKNAAENAKASREKHNSLLATARAAYRKSEDYEGVIVKPIAGTRPIPENMLPWCVSEEELSLPGIERLAIEIPRFHNYARPNRLQSIARKHVIEQVRTHVRDVLPNHILEVFGSERTGLALATSDIDLRLIRQGQPLVSEAAKFPPAPAEREKLLSDLRNLYWRSLHTHKAYILPSIRFARYPLISLQDLQSGLDVQIVLANDTSTSRKIMQGYMDEYPYLAQLHTVVKTMFDVRGLSDVFRGGFGSYSLFMMIVASLRHNPHPRNDAAGGLINFLQFYRDFDTTKQGISIEPVLLFDKAVEAPITDTAKSKVQKGVVKPLPDYMLSLRDPADETNDLGRKGIAIKHVQATFRSLSHQLLRDMRGNTRYSLLAPHVHPCYRLNEERRAKLQSYGSSIVKGMQVPLAAKAKAMREADQANKEVAKEEEEELIGKERDTTWDNMTGEMSGQPQDEARENAVKESGGEAFGSVLEMGRVKEDTPVEAVSVQQKVVAEEVDLTEESEPKPIVDTPANEAKELKSE